MSPVCTLVSVVECHFFFLNISYKICQEVPEKTRESPGAPWQFVGLLPLFDPPRHDSAETIRRALNLGVNVKMITGKFEFYFFVFTCHFLP